MPYYCSTLHLFTDPAYSTAQIRYWQSRRPCQHVCQRQGFLSVSATTIFRWYSFVKCVVSVLQECYQRQCQRQCYFTLNMPVTMSMIRHIILMPVNRYFSLLVNGIFWHAFCVSGTAFHGRYGRKASGIGRPSGGAGKGQHPQREGTWRRDPGKLKVNLVPSLGNPSVITSIADGILASLCCILG